MVHLIPIYVFLVASLVVASARILDISHVDGSKESLSLDSLNTRLTSLEIVVKQQQEVIQQLQHLKSPDYRLSVSICIPCISRHVKYLDTVIQSIMEQTLLPNEIIVSLSETTKEEGQSLEKSIIEQYISGLSSTDSEIKIPVLRIFTTQDKKTHTENNNIAASYATSDIISWMDADDSMHPRRVELLELAFRTLGVNMVLHQYYQVKKESEDLDHLYDHQIWEANTNRRKLLDLVLLPVPEDQTMSWLERLHESGPGQASRSETGLSTMDVLLGSLIYDSYNASEGGLDSFHTLSRDHVYHLGAHNGHVSVHRRVLEHPYSVRWEDIDTGGQTFGEDVRFVKSVLHKLGRKDSTAALLPAALSKYMPSWSASKRCVLGLHILYDCSVTFDGAGVPSVSFNGYDTALGCPQGTYPGYYLDEGDWSKGLMCLTVEERAVYAPELRYIDDLFEIEQIDITPHLQHSFEKFGPDWKSRLVETSKK